MPIKKPVACYSTNWLIDSLNSLTFNQITRRGNLAAVWSGTLVAQEAGLTRIKRSTVIVKGYNEQDVIHLSRLTLDGRLAVNMSAENVTREGLCSVGSPNAKRMLYRLKNCIRSLVLLTPNAQFLII